MVQTTLTQKFRKTDTKEEEDSNVQQSDPNDVSNPLNFVTPRLQRRVDHYQSEEQDLPSGENIVSSQSTIGVLQSQDDEGEEDLDETAVHLTQDELFSFTQKWKTPGLDDDDDEDIPSDEPERIDFSQTQLTQPAADEDYDDHPRGPKRARHHEFEMSSILEMMPPDTDDKWNLVDPFTKTWKIFRKKEKYHIDAAVDTLHPEVVYTIEDFFNDPKVGKMAICHVAVLAKATFIGKNNPGFNASDFEKKFHSKYVGLRYSQSKPLRKLRRIKNTKGIATPAVFFDPPTRETKGPGWTKAFSFTASFGTNETCLIAESPKALDGFAGGGGMSHALGKAGFKVTHAIDNEPVAVATLKQNHQPEYTRVFDQDMNDFIDDAISAKSIPKSPYHCGEIAHVHLSPPCQGFSRMNTTGSEANKEKNNKLSLTFPRLVIGIKSTTASFENVTGMLDDDRVHYVQRIMYEFIMNDYQVRVGILDSSEYGDPQKRQRVVMLVSKKGWKLPDLPEPTHGINKPLKKVKTPQDAIGDLELVAPRTKPGILVLPSGFEVDHHVKVHDLKRDDEDKDYAKTDTLVADKPANTILCGHAIKHYRQNRACTNLETARLQSFPDDWKFAGNPKQVQKQIGNAVPIKLATAIAKAAFSVYDVDPDFFDSPPDA